MPDHTPNSPAELLAMQDSELDLTPAAECVLDTMDDLGLTGPETMMVALAIIRRHRKIHQDMVDKMVEMDQPTSIDRERLAAWVIDCHRLCQAESLLEAVPIPLEGGDDAASC